MTNQDDPQAHTPAPQSRGKQLAGEAVRLGARIAAIALGALSVPVGVVAVGVAGGAAGTDMLPEAAAFAASSAAAIVLLAAASWAIGSLIQYSAAGVGPTRSWGLAVNICFVPSLTLSSGLAALATSFPVFSRSSSEANKVALAVWIIAGLALLAASSLAAVVAGWVARRYGLGPLGPSSIGLAVATAASWMALLGALVAMGSPFLFVILLPVLVVWHAIQSFFLLGRAAKLANSGSESQPHEIGTAPPIDAGSARAGGSVLPRSAKTLIVLGMLAVACYAGGLAGFEHARAMYRRQPASAQLSTAALVVIAARDIPAGHTVSQDMVIYVTYPRDMVIETMLTSLDDAVGREARVDISRGMVVTDGLLVPTTAPTPTPLPDAG